MKKNPAGKITPTLDYETPLWRAGMPFIAGLDEAGRGAWAGPVVAAAVILPANDNCLRSKLAGVRDSKLLTAEERMIWREAIMTCALCWSLGSASIKEIDQLNILRATRLAMLRALEGLTCQPQALLLDALILHESDTLQIGLVKGDQLSLSIAAASILAKTERDRMMVELDETYPGYGFARHKGYGTRKHHQALHDMGVCAIHRVSYRPVYMQQIYQLQFEVE